MGAPAPAERAGATDEAAASFPTTLSGLLRTTRRGARGEAEPDEQHPDGDVASDAKESAATDTLVPVLVGQSSPLEDTAADGTALESAAANDTGLDGDAAASVAEAPSTPASTLASTTAAAAPPSSPAPPSAPVDSAPAAAEEASTPADVLAASAPVNGEPEVEPAADDGSDTPSLGDADLRTGALAHVAAVSTTAGRPRPTGKGAAETDGDTPIEDVAGATTSPSAAFRVPSDAGSHAVTGLDQGSTAGEEHARDEGTTKDHGVAGGQARVEHGGEAERALLAERGGAKALGAPAAAATTGPGRTNAPPLWTDRVLDALRLASVRDGGAMRLTLEPEGLGSIDVRVSVQHDGVRALLVAEHDTTRTLLASQQHVLQAALERSDLRLAGFSVDLGFGAESHASADAEARAAVLAGTATRSGADVEGHGTSNDSVSVPLPVEAGRLSVRV